MVEEVKDMLQQVQITSESVTENVQMIDEEEEEKKACQTCQGDEELCMICYTTDLREGQCVTLRCGHTFHLDCVKQLLSHRWSTLHINFSFMQCPSCKQDIVAEELEQELAALYAYKAKVEELAMKVAVSQGLAQDERFQGDLLAFAMQQCTFYQCSKCEKPYFGGMADCQAQLNTEQTTSKEDLICKDCQLEAFGAG